MILLITNLGGGDLWFQLLNKKAMVDIQAMPSNGDEFRDAMYWYLAEDGPGKKHVVREFGVQTPVIEQLYIPIRVETVLYL